MRLALVYKRAKGCGRRRLGPASRLQGDTRWRKRL